MSVKSESMCTKYWLRASVKLAQEKCVVRLNDCQDMTIGVDLDVKAQTTRPPFLIVQNLCYFLPQSIPIFVKLCLKIEKTVYFLQSFHACL